MIYHKYKGAICVKKYETPTMEYAVEQIAETKVCLNSDVDIDVSEDFAF